MRRRCYGETKAVFKALEGLARRIPAIVVHEGFENGFQRIGFAFSELRGEDSVAGSAEPELNGLMFFVALPFSRDVCALAIDAALDLGADEGRF